jgi:hypothetical protein
MSIIHIGSKSEYVKMALNLPFSIEGWCAANVEIAVPSFHGWIEIYLDAFAVNNFVGQLTNMYGSLQGTASLMPLEEQFTLTLHAKTSGHIHAEGTAWSQATCGNKLVFQFELDQSFLPQVLLQLQDALGGEFR